MSLNSINIDGPIDYEGGDISYHNFLLSFDYDDSDVDVDFAAGDSTTRKRKYTSSTSSDSIPSDDNGVNGKSSRLQRNKEHAKRSRMKKKSLFMSLESTIKQLQLENMNLKAAIQKYVPDSSQVVQEQQSDDSLFQKNLNSIELDTNDFKMLMSLKTARQNFVISDVSKPDNPLVFASQGFLEMTGYQLSDVLGKNCRFLQGPGTNKKIIEKMVAGIRGQYDTLSLIMNYKKDGSMFWNKLFISPLRDNQGKVTHYLGIQSDITDEYVKYYMSRSIAIPLSPSEL
jgi:PAS domain S-box-containing protein